MSEAVDLDSDLFELAMSAQAQPLMDAVQRHITEHVEPIVEEFYALNSEKTDRWSWHPRQLELLSSDLLLYCCMFQYCLPIQKII